MVRSAVCARAEDCGGSCPSGPAVSPEHDLALPLIFDPWVHLAFPPPPRSGFSFAAAVLSRGVKIVPDGGMPHIFHGALAVLHADRSSGDLNEGLLSSLLGEHCTCPPMYKTTS